MWENMLATYEQKSAKYLIIIQNSVNQYINIINKKIMMAIAREANKCMIQERQTCSNQGYNK